MTPGEDDFCPCGGLFVRGRQRARRCTYCGASEPTNRLRVRLPDDTVTWLPVRAAIGARG